MAENKEIKFTEESFEKAITVLTQCKTELSEALEYYINLNNDMKESWIGDSGDAFILTERIVEEQFKERINDLENEIEDLKNAEFTMFEQDKFIGQLIAGSILGPGSVGVVSVASNADTMINSAAETVKNSAGNDN